MKGLTTLICGLIFAASAFAESPPFSYQAKGSLPSGTKYDVVIQETAYKKTLSEPEDDGSMWGIDGGYPTDVVKTFTVKLNGNNIVIRKKFYSDICNISSAEVREEGTATLLVIKGGDAAGSFNAIYRFKQGDLVERVVRMGEMPDDIWEKTIIHSEGQSNKK